MYTLEITVVHKKTKIKYRQETKECLSNAATAKEGWNKGSANDVLLKTVSHICKEAKMLND